MLLKCLVHLTKYLLWLDNCQYVPAFLFFFCFPFLYPGTQSPFPVTHRLPFKTLLVGLSASQDLFL